MPEDISAIKKTLNTFFNPFAMDPSKYWSVSKGDNKLLDAVGHAGALGLGYAGTGMLLRTFLNDIKKRDTEGLTKRVRSNIAAARPTISLDDSVQDEIREQQLRELGTEELEKIQSQVPAPISIDTVNTILENMRNKEASGDMLGEDFDFLAHSDMPGAQKEKDSPGFVRFFNNLVDSAGISSPYHLAAALGATGLGGYLGYAGAGDLYDRSEKKDLDTRISSLRNQIDKELYEEYQRTREVPEQKTAGDEEAPAEEGPGFSDKALYTGTSLYAIYAAAAAALAYNFSRKYTDTHDENRQQLANIEDFTKRRALSEKAPKFLNLTDMTPGKSPEKLRKKKQLQTQSLTAPAPVDKNDPVGALLNP